MTININRQQNLQTRITKFTDGKRKCLINNMIENCNYSLKIKYCMSCKTQFKKAIMRFFHLIPLKTGQHK